MLWCLDSAGLISLWAPVPIGTPAYPRLNRVVHKVIFQIKKAKDK